jgi:transcriptional regulator with XRE-family HTH domain
MEKGAHSNRLKSHINQIAQVAIDLSFKEEKSTLTILKAEGRNPVSLNKPSFFSKAGMEIDFCDGSTSRNTLNIGIRLKELRKKQGLTQSKLAKLVDVTSSNISQVESNLIYPSLTALIKIAEALSVDIKYFFQEKPGSENKFVFTADERTNITFSDLPGRSITGQQLTPMDFEPKGEPYLIEIMPKKKLPSHFFSHKGEEIGYVISGVLTMTTENASCSAGEGDVIYLKKESPTQWENTGEQSVKLLWIKIR